MLVRIRARPGTLYLSRGRTVMATDRNGFIEGDDEHGLFIDERRVIGRLRYTIDGKAPTASVLSNVEQHSFLGYYICVAPGVPLGEPDHGSGHVPPESQQTLEMRIRREVGEGLREEIELTNFADARSTFTFVLEMNDSREPFEVSLAPRESWTHAWSASFEPAAPRVQPRQFATTLSAGVEATLAQAEYDLGALRLDGTVAAGLPLYVALYGRDTLTASWQAAMLGPELMAGTLETLAKFQGTKTDDETDEQPGRMIHEIHRGRRNYGSITTSGLYAFTLAELWHWTGDADLVRPFIDPALRALAWLDRERLQNGFYTYQTRSPHGVKHQAWKDAPGAIVYEDGTEVEPPIATCEEQGFVHIAKLHFAEMLWALGERDEAKRLLHETLELKDRFNEAFWMEDLGFYALALDANGSQVRSIASNAGHCIATAIADESRVRQVADRLFEPDMFSGWGIRTLSSDHPAFNPYSYHLGSIWPVEQGTFAMGFLRYGLHERVQQLARAQFDAAALFDFHRLPELFSGHPRDETHPFPALYPNVNSPQAWSASTVLLLLQSMLGLYPYAPLNLLIVDPHLPDWLPEITLRGLRVGKAALTIRFTGTTWKVLQKSETIHVVQQPMPWSLTATKGERVFDVLRSLRK
jgi:glycogen debranching enzyme